jgi:hypothetical protein
MAERVGRWVQGEESSKLLGPSARRHHVCSTIIGLISGRDKAELSCTTMHTPRHNLAAKSTEYMPFIIRINSTLQSYPELLYLHLHSLEVTSTGWSSWEVEEPARATRKTQPSKLEQDEPSMARHARLFKAF